MVHALEKVQREDVIGPLTSQIPRLMFDGGGECSKHEGDRACSRLVANVPWHGQRLKSAIHLPMVTAPCYSRTEFR